jgi:hypothetical protein
VKMTMYYVRGIGEKRDIHLNFPAMDAQNAYDAFKAELGDKVTVCELTPLFSFEFDDPSKKIVGVN